tara:strand:- start:633 stop:794 length:162 start_codon:yes stop_codon:yes gene_type:complete
MRLVENGAVPHQPVSNQSLGDGIDTPCDGSGGVDVIDAQLPLPVMVSRVKEAS